MARRPSWFFVPFARSMLGGPGILDPWEKGRLFTPTGDIRDHVLLPQNLRAAAPRFFRRVARSLLESDFTVSTNTYPYAYLNWTSAQHTRSLPNDNHIYRVALDVRNNHIEVVCLGMESVDIEAEGIYRSTSELPMWIQEKLAVLSMMSDQPPTTEVKGVGMRISTDVFWVYKT